MKNLSAFLLLASALSIWPEALQLHKRTDGTPRVVGMPIQRRQVIDPVHRDRIRRRDTVQVDLDNQANLYFMNCTVGTPAQPVRLHIDTGSSDLWVNTPSSEFCSTSNGCTSAGLYTANSSSTYEYISSDFNISYADGSGAIGDYVSDTLSIGETTLDRLQFAIGYSSSSSEGILGIGYQELEVQVQRARKAPYENLPARLVANGQIQSNAYSLYLNDLDASTGSILFGGVDTEQYTGTLATLPIQPAGGQFAQFLITLTGIALGNTDITTAQALPVLLDSGSSLTYLPDTIVSSIYQQVDAVYDSSDGAAYVRCSLADSPDRFVFTFSEPSITVGMDEMVIRITDSRGRAPTFDDGTTVCIFGIAPAGTNTIVLGDTFIRSAYLVYDLDNNEISMAQTRFNATSSNVVEIGTGGGAVPGATLVQNEITASGLGDGGAVSTAAPEGSTEEEKSAGVKAVGSYGTSAVAASMALVLLVTL